MVNIAKPLIINEKLEKIIEIIFVLFGLYILIQIIRKMIGGSWSNEDIILGLIIFNLGCMFTIGIMVTQMKSDHVHLREQFKSLANDFKSHIGKNKK